MASRVGPVNAVHLGDRETRQQRGGGGQRVEGGEVLAVGYESLEDAPGEVVGVGDAGGVNSLGGAPERPQDTGGVAGGELFQNVFGYGEYGPVVYGEYHGPGFQGRFLRVLHAVAAHVAQRPDLIMHTGKLFVEDHRVGDDGAGHAARLDDVGHSEQVGYGAGYRGSEHRHVVEGLHRAVYAVLERVGGAVDGFLRDGHQAREFGEVVGRTVKPAGFGEAGSVSVEDGVLEAGVGHGFVHVAGEFESWRVSQRYGGLDGAASVHDFEAEPVGGLALGVGGGHELGLDDDGSAVGRGDEDVEAEGGLSDDYAGVLDAQGAGGQHEGQHRAEGVVGVLFGLA